MDLDSRWDRPGCSVHFEKCKESNMDAAVQSVVGAIHASPTRAVVYLSGGASQTPCKFVSRETAEDIANVAFNRSLQLSMTGTPVAGIGFTGALVSASPKRGDHRCHICTRMQGRLLHYQFTFTKGLRDRIEEDKVGSQLLIKALAAASGIDDVLPLDFKEGEQLMETETAFNEEEQINQLLLGTICMIPCTYGPGTECNKNMRRVVLSGSFNPLHEGHLKLMDATCSVVMGAPCFEISVINADKPPLSIEDIKSRARQFKEAGRTVVFTNQPFFFKKAELFPDSTFVVGADTAMRLIDPKYYTGSHSMMLEVLLGIRRLGCDFLVAGRKIDEKFLVLSDLNIPSELEGMFKSLPSVLFRVDISSTDIRRQSKLRLGTT